MGGEEATTGMHANKTILLAAIDIVKTYRITLAVEHTQELLRGLLPQGPLCPL